MEGKGEEERERERERASAPLNGEREDSHHHSIDLQLLSSCPSLVIANVHKCTGGMLSFLILCTLIMIFILLCFSRWILLHVGASSFLKFFEPLNVTISLLS